MQNWKFSGILFIDLYYTECTQTIPSRQKLFFCKLDSMNDTFLKRKRIELNTMKLVDGRLSKV